MGKLDGKVALITGGASGIGAATARRFLAEGARAMLSDINGEKGEALARELGAQASFVKGDHCIAADNDRMVAATVDKFGSLDILYNNAGMPQRGALEKLDEAVLRRLMDVNLIGPFLASKAAIPALRRSAAAKRAPCILFTASIQSIMVRPNFTAYGASKHGVSGLMSTLALELAPDGIRVNAVGPGPVDTALFRSIVEAGGGDIETFRSGIPLKRLITPEDVAAAAVFLCSADASAITGVLLPVDGGITAR
ncbi:MAG: SDR family NAD(P)-dependent oxidoreductase [Burkholderiales bacterium]